MFPNKSNLFQFLLEILYTEHDLFKLKPSHGRLYTKALTIIRGMQPLMIHKFMVMHAIHCAYTDDACNSLCIQFMVHATMVHSIYGACNDGAFNLWCMQRWCIQFMVHATMVHSIYGACNDGAFNLWCIQQWCIQFMVQATMVYSIYWCMQR